MSGTCAELNQVFGVGFVLSCVSSISDRDDVDNCEQDGIDKLGNFEPDIFTSCFSVFPSIITVSMMLS